MSQNNWFIDIYSDCYRSMGLETGLTDTNWIISFFIFIQKELNYFAIVNILISRDRKSIIGYIKWFGFYLGHLIGNEILFLLLIAFYLF